MISNDIIIAKEIFLKFNGSHFQMEREGEYDTYKRFNICKDQEILWINEHADLLVLKIADKVVADNNLMNLSSIIKQYKENRQFEELLKWAKTKTHNVDSFTNLRIAEEILDIVEVYEEARQKNKLVKEAKIFSVGILHEIYRKPITVAQYYKDIDYLYGCLDNNTIKKRIEMKLKEWDYN